MFCDFDTNNNNNNNFNAFSGYNNNTDLFSFANGAATVATDNSCWGNNNNNNNDVFAFNPAALMADFCISHNNAEAVGADQHHHQHQHQDDLHDGDHPDGESLAASLLLDLQLVNSPNNSNKNNHDDCNNNNNEIVTNVDAPVVADANVAADDARVRFSDVPIVSVPAGRPLIAPLPQQPGVEEADICHGTKYTLAHVVGAGSYGTVYRAEDGVTHEKVAIKKIALPNVRDDTSETRCRSAVRELRILRFLRDQTRADGLADALGILSPKEVLPMHGLDAEYVCSVTPFYSHDLRRVLDSNVRFTEDDRRSVMRSLLRATAYIHSANIAHRDIKPENIFVHLLRRGRAIVSLDAALGDFGQARDIVTSGPRTPRVTTRWYRAPELLRWSPDYDTKVDVWSLGCVFAELFMDPGVRRAIFKGANEKEQLELVNEMMCGDDGPALYMQYGTDMDADAIDLLNHMLQVNPRVRYTAEECLRHPYLNDGAPMPRSSIVYDDSDVEEVQGLDDVAETSEDVLSSEVRCRALRHLLLQETLAYQHDARLCNLMDDVVSAAPTCPSTPLLGTSTDEEDGDNAASAGKE
eukprot:PhM_4_TR18698/c3_g1_i1/m.98660